MAKSKSSSKIESRIEELESYIENCKSYAFSSNKIIVNREEIEDIIQDLKADIPDEVERYRRIISNKEAIEQEAKEHAQYLIDQAESRTNELLSENEIMMQARAQADEIVSLAYRQAEEILDKAYMDGNAYKESAQQYLNDMLINLHTIIYSCIDNTTKNTNKFLESLNQVGETVQDNLNELNQVNSAAESERISEISDLDS